MPASPILEQQLAASWPAEQWKDVSVVVAVSGGADSVGLLRALVVLKQPGPGKLSAAHFNHRLRGEESAGDQQFVAQLCRNLGVPCAVGGGTAATLTGGGDGLEAAARNARYAFLQATAEQIGARYVVTAHTADDQAETVLQRVLRGTGLSGLAGIPRARALGPAVTLLRPLLEIRRSQVVDYLRTIEQPWREDSTNAELHFQRNRIRNELVPLLERDYNRAAVEALLRLAKLAADAQQAIDEQVSALLSAAVTWDGENGAIVDCRKLAGRPRHLVRELLLRSWTLRSWPLQSMGFAEWDLLAGMALGTPETPASAQHMLPGKVQALRRADELCLHRLAGDAVDKKRVEDR
jgi:tRNA(Ile)-lysidine synthase